MIHQARARSDAGKTAIFLALVLVLFVVLTAVMTYPQVLRMSDGVHDPGDPLMVTWVLGWVAHQLPRAPPHIFDANIFYPERNTLAYSETLLVPGLFAAPLHWLGVAPILIYSLVLLSGFALSGVGVALLVRRLPAPPFSPASSSRFRPTAWITTPICSCGRPGSFRSRCGGFVALLTAAACATACCSASAMPDAVVRTTASSWFRMAVVCARC